MMDDTREADEALNPRMGELMSAEDRAAFDQRMAVLSSPEADGWNAVAFPAELAVELAAVCNLDCVMCPVPTTRRPKQLMEPGLFRSIVDQLADERGFVFLPQGFGETMLHKGWADLVGYAVQHGIRPVVMLTNGTLLNEANVDHLLRLEVDVLLVSIDGVDPETYASVRVGGDLRRVEAGVRRLLERRGSRPAPKLVLRIIRMQETREEIDAFFERWRGLLGPDDEIHVNEYNDWAGKVEDKSVGGLQPSEARRPCRMLWHNLSVHADGQVSACCHDSEDELIVGDLRQQTLRQVWEGEALARLRRLHIAGDLDPLPICRACKNWY